MGGRYLVSGAQLGVLKGIAKVVMEDARLDLVTNIDDEIEKIMENQFVFHREPSEGKSIQDDVKIIEELMRGGV